MIRCVVFVPSGLARSYDHVARRLGASRSQLMRQVLEHGLAAAEEQARRPALSLDPPAPGPSQRELDLPPPEASADAPPAPPPSVGASLERLAERTLQASPQVDLETLTALVAAGAETFLEGSPDPDLLSAAVGRVFSQRPNDPPRPVGGHRPPE